MMVINIGGDLYFYIIIIYKVHAFVIRYENQNNYEFKVNHK